MHTRDAKMFSHYTKDYVGKRSFEDFLEIFLTPMVVEKWQKKLHLVGRNELQERYWQYCEKFHQPRASNVNIGRHLGHFGIKCDTKIGPAGAQVRFYSGISWVKGVGSKTMKKSLVKRIDKRKSQKEVNIISFQIKTKEAEETQPEVEETVQETQPDVQETVMETEPDVQETVMETQSDVQETQPQTEADDYLQKLVNMPLDELRDYCHQTTTQTAEVTPVDMNEVLEGLLECTKNEKEQRSEFCWEDFFPTDC